jgi:hypothetical protein
MGKWFRRSLNDLTSFLRGMAPFRPTAPAELDGAARIAATSFLTSIVAGMIGVASQVPMSGFEM